MTTVRARTSPPPSSRSRCSPSPLSSATAGRARTKRAPKNHACSSARLPRSRPDPRSGSRGSCGCASSSRPGRPARTARSPLSAAPPKRRRRPPPGRPGRRRRWPRRTGRLRLGGEPERLRDPRDRRIEEHRAAPEREQRQGRVLGPQYSHRSGRPHGTKMYASTWPVRMAATAGCSLLHSPRPLRSTRRAAGCSSWTAANSSALPPAELSSLNTTAARAPSFASRRRAASTAPSEAWACTS
jgi:hypothetical protein